MKKKLLFIVLPFSILTLSACSLSEIQVKKIEREVSDSESLSDVPDTAALGETIFAENLVMNGGSGIINWSIDKAQVYKTMQDAGLQLKDMYADEFADGVNWNKEKETFPDNRVLVILNITLENINAVSRSNAEEPEKYDKYDFRIDDLGGCSYGPLMYFSKMGDCSVHPSAFHLEPGERIGIDAGYLVDLREIDLEEITFNTAATSKNGTIIQLNLG